MPLYKTASTDQFCDLADAARVNDYNRQVDQEFVDSIDPDKSHICTFHMIHEHRAGEPVEPHVRGRWMVGVKGEEEPVQTYLDVPMDMFNGLDEWDSEKKEIVPAHNPKFSPPDGSLRSQAAKGDAA